MSYRSLNVWECCAQKGYSCNRCGTCIFAGSFYTGEARITEERGFHIYRTHRFPDCPDLDPLENEEHLRNLERESKETLTNKAA